MSKRIKWMPLAEWLGLTAEEHHRLAIHLQKQNADLLVDVDGWHTGDEQLEFQKDKDEYLEKMSIGGKPYREPGR